jgi:hypothetical protein
VSRCRYAGALATWRGVFDSEIAGASRQAFCDLGHRDRSLCRSGCEGYFEDFGEGFGEFGGAAGGVERVDLSEHFEDVCAGDGWFAAEQFEQDQPEDEHVAGGGDGFAAGLFGGHVGGGAAEVGGLGAGPLDRFGAGV